MVSAVNGRCEVYLDGGVRQGTDVFKALALGARAVFIGRPAIYGLAYNVSSSVDTFSYAIKLIIFMEDPSLCFLISNANVAA